MANDGTTLHYYTLIYSTKFRVKLANLPAIAGSILAA